MKTTGAVKVIDASRVAAWTAFFERDRDAAVAYRAELQRDGRPGNPEGQAKQLGLSVALTPHEHRCEHYGDSRTCPFCPREKRDATREMKATLDRQTEELQAAHATIERQSDALSAAHATIRGLEARLTANKKVNRRLLGRKEAS